VRFSPPKVRYEGNRRERARHKHKRHSVFSKTKQHPLCIDRQHLVCCSLKTTEEKGQDSLYVFVLGKTNTHKDTHTKSCSICVFVSLCVCLCVCLSRPFSSVHTHTACLVLKLFLQTQLATFRVYTHTNSTSYFEQYPFLWYEGLEKRRSKTNTQTAPLI